MPTKRQMLDLLTNCLTWQSVSSCGPRTGRVRNQLIDAIARSRRAWTRYALATAALFFVSVVAPRPGLVLHEHRNGEGPHTHAEAGIHQGHVHRGHHSQLNHPHWHPHHHHHDAPRVEAVTGAANGGRGAHWHLLNPVHRVLTADAVQDAGTFIRGLLARDVVDSVSHHYPYRPSARAPPRIVSL